MSEQMILDGKVAAAAYTLVSDSDDSPKPGDAIAIDRWLALKAADDVDLSRVGVILEGDQDISALQGLLSELAFVALHVPKFTDGRVYSHARRLRALWGYEGVILAFGDVLRDQLLYMSRCGINAFYMREDQDLHASLAAFELYTEHYQYN